jgi:methyl-accepting chemotaxis protein
MVAEVTKVSDLVGEIAAAAREQAEGIGQVNEGLGQIDQVTQQNTANAEESAAAAEELSSQAESLRQMLARFTLRRQQQAARVQSGQPASRHQSDNHQIALGWGENS